jgi:hypothetical protein
MPVGDNFCHKLIVSFKLKWDFKNLLIFAPLSLFLFPTCRYLPCVCPLSLSRSLALSLISSLHGFLFLSFFCALFKKKRGQKNHQGKTRQHNTKKTRQHKKKKRKRRYKRQRQEEKTKRERQKTRQDRQPQDNDKRRRDKTRQNKTKTKTRPRQDKNKQ